ncbi:peptidoglycan-containing protein [Fusarium austroafricanum]|uniref:Peptidoglycan-containing protein n=1 Tax=Fusarium austroafricanum TaxID=2364996 RepID=A0A8H4P695_9HYPO|nr:peptidoglycan-containing protein [Fusarium austroafricanum]
MPSQQQSKQGILPLEDGLHHEAKQDASAAPKRIVICCDGTWQSSVSGLKNIPSNVTRLARSVARSGKDNDGKVWQQVVYYDAGIGTGDLGQAEANRQGGAGIGFVGNVIEAYNFIVLNYNIGDEIFCFGFSRGAYTARAVAGLVTDIGIVCPKDLQDFPDLYALYQKNPDGFHFRKSQAYMEWVNGVPSKKEANGGSQIQSEWESPPHHDAPESSRFVKVVGVFDTVGSLGIPDLPWTRFNLKFLEKTVGIADPGFHNIHLSPSSNDQSAPKPAKNIEQLWSDWEKMQNNTSATKKQLQDAWGAVVDGEMYEYLKDNKSELLQVWFPGVHINIGGGNDDLLTDKKSDLERGSQTNCSLEHRLTEVEIALISFGWMCEQVAPYLQFVEDGSLVDLGKLAVQDRYNLLKPLLTNIQNGDEKDFGPGPLSSRIAASLDRTGIKKADVRKIPEETVSGWATGPIVDSFTGAMIAGGSIDRVPGNYTKDDKGRELGETYEMIHPCVKYRMNKIPSYKPKSLRGFERTTYSGKGYVWTKGNVKIPEFVIKTGDAFSRHVAEQDRSAGGNAREFLKSIDTVLV